MVKRVMVLTVIRRRSSRCRQLGWGERLSAGEKEIPPKEVKFGRWVGGTREMRWSRWKIVWMTSRVRGLVGRNMAVPEMYPMLSVTFPSSIWAKR